MVCRRTGRHRFFVRGKMEPTKAPAILYIYIYFIVISLKFHCIFHYISCFMNIVPSAYIDNGNMPMQSDAYKCL